MNESEGYVVYFFPQALEALGDAIKPYLRDGPGGQYVLCQAIDTAGSLIEMTTEVELPDGRSLSIEVMIPQSMVRMIVSARSDAAFGFSPRVAPALMAGLPPVAGAAPPANAPTEAFPHTGEAPATEGKSQAQPSTSDAMTQKNAQEKLPPEG